MSYFECFSVTVLTIYCLILNLDCFMRKIGYWCTVMKTRNTAHSWVNPPTIHVDSLFSVFPSDIWYKINKLLKYYEYQLTKLSSEGGQEGFKVSSWFLKIMNLVEYQIAKKSLNFHHRCTCRCRLHHHYSWGYHVWFYLTKQS